MNSSHGRAGIACDAANRIAAPLDSESWRGCNQKFGLSTMHVASSTGGGLPSDSPRGGKFVNKTELIEHIARQADISKAAAARALEALIGGVKATLKKNNTVSLVGFGTFSVGKRAARSGRNPRTGAPIKIKAAKVPKFRPGKALKDALN